MHLGRYYEGFIIFIPLINGWVVGDSDEIFIWSCELMFASTKFVRNKAHGLAHNPTNVMDFPDLPLLHTLTLEVIGWLLVEDRKKSGDTDGWLRNRLHSL